MNYHIPLDNSTIFYGLLNLAYLLTDLSEFFSEVIDIKNVIHEKLYEEYESLTEYNEDSFTGIFPILRFLFSQNSHSLDSKMKEIIFCIIKKNLKMGKFGHLHGVSGKIAGLSEMIASTRDQDFILLLDEVISEIEEKTIIYRDRYIICNDMDKESKEYNYKRYMFWCNGSTNVFLDCIEAEKAIGRLHTNPNILKYYEHNCSIFITKDSYLNYSREICH